MGTAPIEAAPDLLECAADRTRAGPFDLGLYGALNSWFVSRRTIATSIATVAQMSGLVALPMIAQVAMQALAFPGQQTASRRVW